MQPDSLIHERLNLSVEASQAREALEQLVRSLSEILNQRDKLIDFIVSTGFPYDYQEGEKPRFPKELAFHLSESWSVFDPSKGALQHFSAISQILDLDA